MRILFLVYHGFSDHSGISKKIHSQVEGLRQNGHEVHLCHYGFSDDGHRCRYIDNKIIKDYGTSRLGALRQRIDFAPILSFCREAKIDLVYARHFQNATPWLVGFFRRLRKSGIKAVTEIPTFPYDKEFAATSLANHLKLFIDRLFRRALAKEMCAMVTFSDAEEIFGKKTIRISNGVDLDAIPLVETKADGGTGSDAVDIIGVAEVHFWHAFDRMLTGLGEYYRNEKHPRDIRFHIVGGVWPTDMEQFQQIIKSYDIESHVVFHGLLFGEKLNEVFDRCRFAVGSLGRHRSGITVIKTLKNREYATRGLPFIYSEEDSDFDHQPYIIKATPDETPIDVKAIVQFIDTFSMPPAEIRHSVEHLSWKIQMQRVVDAIAGK